MSDTLNLKTLLNCIQIDCKQYIYLQFWTKLIGSAMPLAGVAIATSFVCATATTTYGIAPQNLSQLEESSFISKIVPNKDTDLTREVATKEKSDIFLDKQALVNQNSQTVFQDKQHHLIAQADSPGVGGDNFRDVEKLRQQLLIEPIFKEGAYPIAPASTAGIPSGYGANFGDAYVGGGLNFPLDQGRTDGSLSAGFGLGDSVKSVGLEFDFNLTSVGVDHFGSSGEIGLKLHKYLPGGAAIAIGWANPIRWGNATRAKEILYGVVSKSFDLLPNNPNNRLPLTITFGLNSGSFRTEGDIVNNPSSNKFRANFFGGLGLRVLPQVSLVSSWTGSELNVGASVVPLKNVPIVLNGIFSDVTGETTTGLGFTLSGGYIFHF